MMVMVEFMKRRNQWSLAVTLFWKSVLSVAGMALGAGESLSTPGLLV